PFRVVMPRCRPPPAVRSPSGGRATWAFPVPGRNKWGSSWGVRAMRDGVGVPAWLARLAVLGEDEIARVVRRMTDPAVRALDEWWTWQRHDGQSAARPDWRVGLIMGGGGVGKARGGGGGGWAWVAAVAGGQ